MNKNIYWIVAVIMTIVLFVGAYFLYDKLKDDYAPDTELVFVNTPSSGGSQTQPTEPSTTEQAAQATQSTTQEQATTQQAVQTTADFTVVDANGNEVQLSDYFGKPIVLNFWASWCPPCKSEMPYFEEAYKSNPDIQFLMVNMTAGDSMENAKAFIAEEGYTFPVFFDTMGQAAYAYSASSLPMTLFIDENGVLITYAIGALSADTLNQGILYIKTAAN